MRQDGSLAVARSHTSRAQLITLAVGNARGRDAKAAVRWTLARIGGVEMVDAHPDRGAVRVWVFGDGSVEPLALVDELASCGFGASVLEHEFKVFA